MGYIFTVIVATLVIEFLFVMMSYDDFGENIGWSMFWGILLTLIIIGFNEVELVKVPSEQEVMLMEQDKWGADVVEDMLDIEKIEQREVDEYYSEMDRKVDNLVEVIESDEFRDAVRRKVNERPVPSTSSYIDGSRRDYSTKVIYDIETREACDDDECFKVRTIQHTDGTFWACKRNYGTCYEY